MQLKPPKSDLIVLTAKEMLSYMDLTVDPCQDFYQYACGNWEKKNPIPKDKAGLDTFEILRESLDSILRDLLLEPSDNDTEVVRKAKYLFESCMNEGIYELNNFYLMSENNNKSSKVQYINVLRIFNTGQ